jgi:hypothetical protein
MSVPSHPLIAQYVDRHGISDAVRSDGRATFRIDDKYRVHLSPARSGWLAINARLCALPPKGVARDDFLVAIGKQAAGMLAPQPSACVVDPDEDSLWLQQMVRPDSDATSVDEAVGSFANALSFWTAAVRRAA